MNGYKNCLVCVLGLSCLLAGAAFGDIRLPAVFGDHMVLQQEAAVPIWGWAEPGEAVAVKGSWQWFSSEKTVADENGRWQVQLKTPKANNKPVSVTINGQNTIVLQNLLIGEVWVCSGQSNMEYTPAMLGDDKNLTAAANADNPHIRLFDVKRATADTPKADCEGTWQLCTPETVRKFSATAYYFGKQLQESLGVPVGLISTNWGGTPVEAWTRLEALQKVEEYSNVLVTMNNPEKAKAEYEEKVRAWEDQVAALDPGYMEGWHQPEANISDWKDMKQPREWTGTELEDFDGIVWFRRRTSLPPSWAKNDMLLHLGPIDDMDTVWVNGVKIGSTGGHQTPRVYRIPASVLKVGPNIIAVRVIDTGSRGGFRGDAEQMRIGPEGAAAKMCATVAGDWTYKVSRTGAGGIPYMPENPQVKNFKSPTVLYNAMIAPLIPFRIAGAIWYQGESNCYDPMLYRSLFPAMIFDWRAQWNQGNFPFYYVQISPFKYDEHTQSQALREAQLLSLWVPNTGMAVTMDIGAESDIHPKNKADVGDRLARWALAKTYGLEGIDFSGPLYRAMKFDGNTIRIAFDYVDGGLVAKDGQLRDFEIAGVDRNFIPAKAVIEGDTVVVSSDEIEHPMAVRYGWSNWVDGSLFNKAGLPASSFRTDDWPLK